MLDIRWIREQPADLDRALRRRGLEPRADGAVTLDEQRRSAQTALQQLLGRRNEVSKQIGAAKAQGGDAQPLIDEVAQLKVRIADLEAEERRLGDALQTMLQELPNSPADDAPDGADETANVELRRYGEPRRMTEAKEHFVLGEALGMMDFAAAAAMSGARFVVLRGPLARLERALGQFMIDLHTAEHGYTEVLPPFLVRDNAVLGTGQLPKFADDLFHTDNGYWLIPTAEVPLTYLAAGAILETEALPYRYAALTACYRSEAGAAGKDTRGMIRQHQFNKCELVSVTTPEQSEAEHERMTRCAETVLERLGLAYRVVSLATGDLGFAARKTYDIEVWLPGQGAYREISSCSNCGDFQARRMNARFRPPGERATRFVHTLNGSGVAVGRALIAVMETYQRPDGSIEVPAALRPYMGGQEVVSIDG